MKYILIFVLSLLTANISLSAKDLKGTVNGLEFNDKLVKLPGANIVWKGTQIGAISDKNGEFTIERSEKSNILIISYVGYKRDTTKIGRDLEEINITLTQALNTDDVIVEGLATGTVLSSESVRNDQKLTLQGLRKAACCNLSESFTTTAAVDVEQTDAVSGAKQIKLLGLNGKYTQIMIEKVPMMRGLISTFGLNYVPGSWMESILISKGASSVSNGFESITGQINVEYKKPDNEENMHLNLFANQYNRFEGDLNANYNLNNELSTMILLHGNIKDKFNDHNGDGFIDSPNNDQVNIMNRWRYFSDDFRSQIAFRYISENRKGGQQVYFDNNDPAAYGMNFKTNRYELFLKTGVVVDEKDYKSLGLIVTAANHKQNAMFGRREYTGEQNTFDAKLLYQFDIYREEHKPNHELSFGAAFIYDDYQENFSDIIFDKKEIIPGAFAEYTMSGFNDFTVIGGVRLDNHNEHGAFFTPRLHLKYNFDDLSTIRASAGKGFRTSNIFAENVGLMSSSREFIINDNLEMEEAWNYGLNFTTSFSIWDVFFTLNTDFYHTNFINQIIADMDSNPSEVTFFNLKDNSYSNLFFQPCMTDLKIPCACFGVPSQQVRCCMYILHRSNGMRRLC